LAAGWGTTLASKARDRTGKIEVARQSPLDVQNEANLALVHANKDRSE
jgi:hypothetical protein